jgi:hypothetical protein
LYFKVQRVFVFPSIFLVYGTKSFN